ncbi:hypothetical protein V6N11_036903 [Hibiscus sabdariffa]|uniref:Zinc finger, CCHC-type n=1 Tax=Hibiscus sabdariffa TaxID=183260 RepID=A0ABR2RBS3_9ROSI
MANNTISLRSLLEKEKLNGINFLDWFRNLRIVLKQERKEYVIEEAVPNDPEAIREHGSIRDDSESQGDL